MTTDIFGEARAVVALAQSGILDGHLAMREFAEQIGATGQWIDHPQRAEVVEYLHQQIDRLRLRWPMRIRNNGACRESEFYTQGFNGHLGASHVCEALADRRPQRDPFNSIRVEEINRAGLDDEAGNKFSIPRPNCYPLPINFTRRGSWDAERLVWSVQRGLIEEALLALPKQHDSWRKDGEAILDTMSDLYEMIATSGDAMTPTGRVEAPYIAQTIGPMITDLVEREQNLVTVRRRFGRVMKYAGTLEGVWFAVFLRHAPLHWGTSFGLGHWKGIGGENVPATDACDLRWASALGDLYALARKEGRNGQAHR